MRRSKINPYDYIRPIGIKGEGDIVQFSGTGFGYLSKKVVLTARHVVDANPEQVYLQLSDKSFRQPIAVHTHPKDDVAALIFSEDCLYSFSSPDKENIDSTIALGEEILSFGYPYVDLGPGEKNLEPRLLTGNLQRNFTYLNSSALELSFSVGKGQSGSPVFLANSIDYAVGIVTTNFESKTIVDYHEEHLSENSKEIHKVTKVQCYGIALSLSQYEKWFQEVISGL